MGDREGEEFGSIRGYSGVLFWASVEKILGVIFHSWTILRRFSTRV